MRKEMRSVAPRHVRKRDVNEEPGAGELHAGICEGGARQLASLPRLRGATSGLRELHKLHNAQPALVNRRRLNIASGREIPADLFVSDDIGRCCTFDNECRSFQD